MSAAIIIPARYGSTRFPGKPFCMVKGVTMLERVWHIASNVNGASRVIIATDDERIMFHAASFGAEAIMTSEACANGTERAHDAVYKARVTEQVIVNLQGDSPLTPPWVLEAMIAEMDGGAAADIVTPAVALEPASFETFLDQKQTTPSSGTTVVFDLNYKALYFSKAVIPFPRYAGHAAIFRHIGLYAYTREALARYVELTPAPLEKTEGLEQLRALEHGMIVRVAVVDYQGRTPWSIDAPEDVAVAEAIIDREGELDHMRLGRG